MSIKSKEVKDLWSKLSEHKDIELKNFRETKHTLIDVFYKGKLILMPLKISHGKKEIIIELLMRDYKLDKTKMRNLMSCSFSTEQWIDKLKEKKYI